MMQSMRQEITALETLLSDPEIGDIDLLQGENIWAVENESEFVDSEGPWTEMALTLSKRRGKDDSIGG